MSDANWVAEVQRYLSLDRLGRQEWLADLLFSLTIFARDTYCVGGDSLTDQVRMRRFNELMHRTATQLRNEYRAAPGMPNEAFGRMLCEEAGILGFGANDFRKLVG